MRFLQHDVVPRGEERVDDDTRGVRVARGVQTSRHPTRTRRVAAVGSSLGTLGTLGTTRVARNGRGRCVRRLGRLHGEERGGFRVPRVVLRDSSRGGKVKASKRVGVEVVDDDLRERGGGPRRGEEYARARAVAVHPHRLDDRIVGHAGRGDANARRRAVRLGTLPSETPHPEVVPRRGHRQKLPVRVHLAHVSVRFVQRNGVSHLAGEIAHLDRASPRAKHRVSPDCQSAGRASPTGVEPTHPREPVRGCLVHLRDARIPHQQVVLADVRARHLPPIRAKRSRRSRPVDGFDDDSLRRRLRDGDSLANLILQTHAHAHARRPRSTRR